MTVPPFSDEVVRDRMFLSLFLGNTVLPDRVWRRHNKNQAKDLSYKSMLPSIPFLSLSFIDAHYYRIAHLTLKYAKPIQSKMPATRLGTSREHHFQGVVVVTENHIYNLLAVDVAGSINVLHAELDGIELFQPLLDGVSEEHIVLKDTRAYAGIQQK